MPDTRTDQTPADQVLTRVYLSLLLYLETRAVDHGGRVDTQHMNADDFETAKKWNESGFIQFGRISSADKFLRYGTHWCYLSDEAWEAAHRERRARAARMWESRRFVTTKELQGETP